VEFNSVCCGCGKLPEESRSRTDFVDGPNVSHGDSAQTTPATTKSTHRLRESARLEPTAISSCSLHKSQPRPTEASISTPTTEEVLESWR
jgi:hypothetical protein